MAKIMFPCKEIWFGLILVQWVFMQPTLGHEAWIEPHIFQGSVEKKIIAEFKLGQDFKGDSLSYIPENIIFAGVKDRLGNRALRGFSGDYPAINEITRVAGLQIIYVLTKKQHLTYADSLLFEQFLIEKGLDWVIGAHQKRNLPEKNITESFSRCAKALIRRGVQDGQDEAIGMPFEFIIENNPYDNESKTVSEIYARLLWKGKPHRFAQITIFNKATRLLVSKTRTDEEGRVKIPINEGGVFLLNSVHMISGGESLKPMWHSYWASSTFEIK